MSISRPRRLRSVPCANVEKCDSAGLVPERTACLCGLGPVARDLGTPHEAVQRISLVQRTLLLARYLVEHGED